MKPWSRTCLRASVTSSTWENLAWHEGDPWPQSASLAPVKWIPQNRAYRTRRCSRYSTAARIWPASHVIQSSLSGSPGTPVPRPTATSLTTRCCAPWCSHRARNRCVRATEGKLAHTRTSVAPKWAGAGRRRMWLPAQALHVHAALQARAVGHNQPRNRDRTFDRASLADTHQLARLDAPAHLAENHHQLRRQPRLDPAGWTDRQDMLRQFDSSRRPCRR